MNTSSKFSLAAIAAMALTLSTGASADVYSKDFAKSYGDTLKTWVAGDNKIDEISCEDSRAATIKSGTAAKSICARITSDQRQSEVGLYRYVDDLRTVENGDYGYIVHWSELESGARIYLEEQPPQDVLPMISNRFKRDFNDWSRDKTYSAGFTRQFQGATAKNADGKECIVLTGKRGKSSILTVLTCGETLPEKAELKALLKTLP